MERWPSAGDVQGAGGLHAERGPPGGRLDGGGHHVARQGRHAERGHARLHARRPLHPQQRGPRALQQQELPLTQGQAQDLPLSGMSPAFTGLQWVLPSFKWALLGFT